MITCISNSSQMLSGWVLGPFILGILLAFRNSCLAMLGNGGTLTILNSWNLSHSALSDQANQPLFEGVAKSYCIIVRKWAQTASQFITFFSLCELGKDLNMWKELSTWFYEYCAWSILKLIFRIQKHTCKTCQTTKEAKKKVRHSLWKVEGRYLQFRRLGRPKVFT